MTRIPKRADLILNKVSGAPDFWIDNVIVMAGVPSIMQAMLDEVAAKLKIGVRTLSETVCADAREGDIGKSWPVRCIDDHQRARVIDHLLIRVEPIGAFLARRAEHGDIGDWIDKQALSLHYGFGASYPGEQERINSFLMI